MTRLRPENLTACFLTRFNNKQDFCVLYKAHQIKKWMRSILPEEWKIIQKDQVQSEIFFTALLQYQQKERKDYSVFTPAPSSPMMWRSRMTMDATNWMWSQK